MSIKYPEKSEQNFAILKFNCSLGDDDIEADTQKQQLFTKCSLAILMHQSLDDLETNQGWYHGGAFAGCFDRGCIA